MFLAFIAFVMAFFALLRTRDLSDRIKRLESDRDEAAARLATLQKLVERLRTQTVAVAKEAERAGEPPTPATAAIATPTAPPPAAPPEVTPVVAAPPSPAPAAKAPSPPPSPARPPVTLTPIEVEPPPPPIDWESLLGVKGAAWVGGIALIASAIFFARWTIEQGLVTPELRFAFMLMGGIGALVAAELGLRKGYERTANPLSGAGIAILYIAFFAGHSRYDLISMPAAFAGMVFVTITACVLAVRYDAFPTAVLGLLGGFATPIALSTGQDRPVGLFSYILLLNLGLFAVGVKRRWPGLFELGLLGTLLIQVGWFSKFMSPSNMLIAVVVFAVFGALYLVLPVVSKEEDSNRVLLTGAIGGLTPFLFGIYLASSPEYVEQWPLLFGMVALLDLAILAMAVLRGRVGLLISASVATSITLALWAGPGLKAGSGASLWGATLSTIFIIAIFGSARRAADRFGSLETSLFRALEMAALTAWAGLGLFGLILIGNDRGAPAGPFLALAAALALLLIERAGHEGRVKGALSLGATGLAMLIQIWFLSSASPSTVLGYLAVPVLFSLLLSFFAGRTMSEDKDVEGEIAVRVSCWVSIFGLFLTLAEARFALEGWPLFLAMTAQILVVTGSVLRSDWTIGLPALLGASALHMMIWQLAYLKPEKYTTAFGFTALFYFFFLLLPMIVPFARWREALLPWATSALAGPAFFLPFYYVYEEAFGESAIGLLPLAMAGVSVFALRVVSSRFTAGPGDPLGARLRLRYLALFSAVALWFIAVAIPLQLDKQWITLGWALEAMALCWLFGRLPHRGLPVFAGILYALVGVRLLFNPEILEYHERGAPLFNWILYTYGIATLCCLIGQSLLRRASDNGFIQQLANAIALNGLLLGFWLVNLEILDYFSTGPYIAISDGSGYSVKLALSAGWGLYAIVLLVTGVAKDLKPLRYLSLAFLLLTVAKVFLYDLSELGGIFRVFSFLGLAVGLILVSLFYQRFVFKKNQ
ncbi:MAG TPA: DUF2339 domain-containing protein [Vicinamibacteria bacterium]|nr:DUF2339 domain-containing protein [Vicinamibacteria bacterium]